MWTGAVCSILPVTPRPGQIFEGPNGPMMYVRTEQRPGSPEPEHLFMTVMHDLRVTAERWYPASEPLPPEWTLVVDSLVLEHATKVEGQLVEAEGSHEALKATLRDAVAMLPESRGEELRQAFRERMAHAETV